MTGITNLEGDKLYNHIVVETDYPAQTELWIALFTVAPTDATFGTEVVVANGYGRVQFEGTPANWQVPTAGSGDNAALVDFGAATGGNWGTIVAAALMNDQTAAAVANMMAWGDLATNRVVNDGDTFQFPIGNITLDMNAN